MNREKKFLLIVSLSIILFILGCGAVQAAQIVSIKGKAQVKFSNNATWAKATVGMTVEAGDNIKTARRSQVDILLKEGTNNFIRIDELTLVIFDSQVPGQIHKFDISQGQIYANIEVIEQGFNYEVITPSSVAGVRGTGWGVKSKAESDEITVYENAVYVKAFNKSKQLLEEIVVPEQYKTVVDRFMAPSTLFEISKKEMIQWKQMKTEISKNIEAYSKEQKKTKSSSGPASADQTQGDQSKDEGDDTSSGDSSSATTQGVDEGSSDDTITQDDTTGDDSTKQIEEITESDQSVIEEIDNTIDEISDIKEEIEDVINTNDQTFDDSGDLYPPAPDFND